MTHLIRLMNHDKRVAQCLAGENSAANARTCMRLHMYHARAHVHNPPHPHPPTVCRGFVMVRKQSNRPFTKSTQTLPAIQRYYPNVLWPGSEVWGVISRTKETRQQRPTARLCCTSRDGAEPSETHTRTEILLSRSSTRHWSHEIETTTTLTILHA